jgi:hypothetical protein
MTIQAGVLQLNYLDGRTEREPVDFERQLSGRIHSAGDSHFSDRTPVEANGGRTDGAPVGVQILGLAEEHEALIIGQRRTKTSPSQAGQEVIQRSSGRYDSMILDGFAKALGGTASGAGA